VWKSNLQTDFNVRVFESFDTSSSALLRELDESDRFVQKSAESTSIWPSERISKFGRDVPNQRLISTQVQPWGKSDIYCVVRLEPLGPLAIDADPEEISDCKWYDAAAFAAEERHPLITKVLAEVYGLRRGDAVAGAFEPKCDFANLGVQWPGRDPYATYFPKVSGAKRLPARIRAGNNQWNGPVQQNFKPLYLGQIEVNSADFWTNRFLSSSA
jgi:hypothetical protein